MMRRFSQNGIANNRMIHFNQAVYTASYGISSQLPQSKELEIAFAGRSNVGKSSLLNKLFNRKGLARVSSVPGKTATINFYKADQIVFVDLPGYGYAKVGKSEKQRWSELIEGYFNDDRNFGLIVQLIDMRHAPTKLDLEMIHYLIEREFPFIIVMTKSDKLNKTERQKRLAAYMDEIPYVEDITMIPFSAENGEGVEELRQIISELAEEEAEIADSDEE